MAIIISDFKPAPCEECGMNAAHHGILRFSARFDSVARATLRPLDGIMETVVPISDRLIDKIAPFVASLFTATGLAVKITAPDARSSETAQALWEEAKRREIEMYEIRILGLPRRHFIARSGDTTIAFEGIPRLARRQKSIAWIDNKAEMKRRFGKAGFPVAMGGQARNEKEALGIFNSLSKPVIVKPEEGSGGRHTTVKIETEEGLRAAYRNARVISPAVVVEEELSGPVYRATLVGGKLRAVLRRDPPRVVGNGRLTVRELAEKENENPLREGPVFAKIDIDSPAARRELARQKIAPENIPKRGQVVYFHFKVNWGVGGTSWDATPETHPDNRKLFEDIGKFLGEDVAGIDFMIPDISKSWRRENRCGVIECNSLPLIGNHHFPYTGPIRNVAEAIWDMVFPKTQKAPERASAHRV